MYLSDKKAGHDLRFLVNLLNYTVKSPNIQSVLREMFSWDKI